MADDTRDRVIRMEAELSNLEKKLEKMTHLVEDMHDILQSAKGARWMILGIAGLIGGASGFIIKLFPFLVSR